MTYVRAPQSKVARSDARRSGRSWRSVLRVARVATADALPTRYSEPATTIGPRRGLDGPRRATRRPRESG